MAKGGYRPGAGRPKGAKNLPLSVQIESGKRTPLEYMLEVMNDETADQVRRDRMAIAAAPFVHERGTLEPQGKKAQKQAAASTAQTGTEWSELLTVGQAQ